MQRNLRLESRSQGEVFSVCPHGAAKKLAGGNSKIFQLSREIWGRWVETPLDHIFPQIGVKISPI